MIDLLIVGTDGLNVLGCAPLEWDWDALLSANHIDCDVKVPLHDGLIEQMDVQQN